MDRIDPATTIGDVHLTISDLDRSIAFYTERLGFRVHRRDSNSAVLGAGGVDMLALMQSPGAPRVRGTTGLYHFAILVPARVDLSKALRRLIETNTRMQGVADHGVSEACTLPTRTGMGSRSIGTGRARVAVQRRSAEMTTDPLDLDDRRRTAADRSALSAA